MKVFLYSIGLAIKHLNAGLEEAHWHFGIRMAEICSHPQNLMVGHPPMPYYSTKIIVLRHIEIL